MIRQLVIGLGGAVLCGAGLAAFAFGADVFTFMAGFVLAVAGAGAMTYAVGATEIPAEAGEPS